MRRKIMVKNIIFENNVLCYYTKINLVGEMTTKSYHFAIDVVYPLQRHLKITCFFELEKQ